MKGRLLLLPTLVLATTLSPFLTESYPEAFVSQAFFLFYFLTFGGPLVNSFSNDLELLASRILYALEPLHENRPITG